jgi:7-cyano-7-deazaguanine synthase
MDNRSVVLMSGGIDSGACARFLRERGDRVTGIHFNYGQKAARFERESAARISELLEIPLQIASVEIPTSLGTGELVGRNAFLVFAAMMTCQLCSGVIALGIHSGSTYYDTTPAFLQSADRVVSEYSDGRVRLIAPFINWNKKNIFDYYTASGLPIELTYSCEAGEMPPCGLCLSCRDRRMLGC